uniref:Uncharacterized protein n=1 Tax=Setaria italica TaxID=4555 RepID=K4AG02_SETIT
MAAMFHINGSCIAILIYCRCIIWHIAPQWHCGDIIPCIIDCMQHCCCSMANGDCCINIASKGEPPMVNARCIMQDCMHGTMEPIPIIGENELTMVNGCCIMHDCMHGSIMPIPVISGKFCGHVAEVVATAERARSTTRAMRDAMVFEYYLAHNKNGGVSEINLVMG